MTDAARSPSLGIACDGRNPLGVLREQVRRAEAAGAASVYISSHLFLRDPAASAAVVLSATDRVRVVLMAMSPHAMHPVHIAMAAATLDELAPGRVALCVGTGAPGDLADAGIEPRRPLQALAEAVEIARLLLAGEPVTYKGEIFRIGGRRLGPGPRRVPVFLAAARPGSLGLAGRIADGVVLSAASSVEFVRWSLELAARGTAGRPFERVGLVYTAAADRAADALGRFRRQLAITLRGGHHAANLALAGSALDQAAVRAALAREDFAAAEALVSDEVVRRHSASGTADEARARLGAYRAAGLDEIALAGLSSPEETERVLAAVAP